MAIEVQTKEKTHYLNKLSEVIEKYFLERDILLRPLGNVLYVAPPVCIQAVEMRRIYTTITEFLDGLSAYKLS